MASKSTKEENGDSGLESTSTSSLSSSTSNEQGEERNWKRMQRVYYDLYADAVFQFSDGATVKFNKACLAAKSDVFHESFAQSSSSDVVKIQDYDSATFKLFLDCLLNFQKMSVLDALMVFPIAWKYQMEEFIRKCVQVLKPTDLDENVCLTLNLALFCKCNELTDEILNFLTSNLIYKIIDYKEYRSLLEPESIAVLLKKIVVDSCVLHNVFKWGRKYLEKKNNSMDLKSLFKDYNIISFVKLSAFETTQSIFYFNDEFKHGKNFFDPELILEDIKQHGYDSRKSRWLKMEEDSVYHLVEKLVVPNVIFLVGFTTVIHITRNPVVFYDYPEVDSDEEEEEHTSGSSVDLNKKKYINIAAMLNYDISFQSEHLRDNETLEAEIDLIEEDNTDDFSKTRDILGKINLGSNEVCDLNVEIKYTFSYDGRILVTSCDRNSMRCGKRNCMHFTSGIRVSHEKN